MKNLLLSKPKNNRKPVFSYLYVHGALIYLFLYIPLIVVFLYSLNGSKSMVRFEGITLKWYVRLLESRELLTALGHSLEVSAIAVILAIFIGTTGAVFLNRVNFKGKALFKVLANLPIVLPGIIIGLSLLVLFLAVRIELSKWTVILGHVTFTSAVVMFQVLARLQRLSKNLENAAMDLGANPLKAFYHVTLPMIKRAIIGGALLAFTMSFDEIIVTYFLTSTFNTLPVYLYGMMRFGLTPEVYAISTVVLVFSILLIVLTARFTGNEDDLPAR
jgi:ABC-type spermidine/putrescine transport system, permease component II